MHVAPHDAPDNKGVFIGHPPINGIPFEYMFKFLIARKLLAFAVFYVYYIYIIRVCCVV